MGTILSIFGIKIHSLAVTFISDYHKAQAKTRIPGNGNCNNKLKSFLLTRLFRRTKTLG